MHTPDFTPQGDTPETPDSTPEITTETGTPDTTRDANPNPTHERTTPVLDDFESRYNERRRREQEEEDKQYRQRKAAEDNQAAEEAERTEAERAKLAKSQTVRFSVTQTNGRPIHFCEDDEWRTDEDMATIGLEDE